MSNPAVKKSAPAKKAAPGAPVVKAAPAAKKAAPAKPPPAPPAPPAPHGRIPKGIIVTPAPRGAGARALKEAYAAVGGAPPESDWREPLIGLTLRVRPFSYDRRTDSFRHHEGTVAVVLVLGDVDETLAGLIGLAYPTDPGEAVAIMTSDSLAALVEASA